MSTELVLAWVSVAVAGSSPPPGSPHASIAATIVQVVVERIALALLVACGTEASPTPGETSTGAGSTALGSTAASTDTVEGGTLDSQTTEAVTSLAPTGDSTQTGPTTGSSESGNVEGKSCDLTFMDPVVDPAAAVVAGDGPDQIPTEVGAALVRNCGCHYTDDAEGYTDYAADGVPLSTHADFHAAYTGNFPAGYQGMPTYLAVEQRVTFFHPLPMPPLGCSVEGEPGTITAVDRAVFADWFAAGAPDGAND